MARRTKSKSKKSRYLIYVPVYLFFGFIIAVILFFVSLPNVSKLKHSVKVDRIIKHEDGTKYIEIPYTVGEKNPNWISLRYISGTLQHAVLVAEDIEFFNHNGFNYKEIGESIKKNIKEWRPARGGSTITQQLMKNIYLSGRKSMLRKFKEAALTYKAEKSLSKERIFELYLNVIEWGYGVYGIRMAAKKYFNKHPRYLNEDESAYLAALIPNPRKYSHLDENPHLEKYLTKRQLEIKSWMERGTFIRKYIDGPQISTSQKKASSPKKVIKSQKRTVKRTPAIKAPVKKRTVKKPNQKTDKEINDLMTTIEAFQPEDVFKKTEGSKAPALEEKKEKK